MAEIATPQHVIADVFNSLRQVQKRPFCLFDNRWQKWSLWTVIVAIVGIFASAVLYNYIAWPKPQAQVWARLARTFEMVVVVGATGLVVASVLGGYRLVFPLHRSFVSPITTAFTSELALIARLHDTYPPCELAYALDRLTLLVAQSRARTALFLGPSTRWV